MARFVLVSSALIDCSQKTDAFSEIPTSPCEKVLLFGPRDGLFLYGADEVSRLVPLEHSTPPLGTSEWTSQLIIEVSETRATGQDAEVPPFKLWQKKSECGTSPCERKTDEREKFPLLALIAVKIKDHALAQLGTDLGLAPENVLEYLASAFHAAMQRLWESGPPLQQKLQLQAGLFYSYAASEDFVLLLRTNSAVFIHDVLRSVRALSVSHLPIQNPNKLQGVHHLVRETYAFFGTVWTPSRSEGLQSSPETVFKKIVDNEPAYCLWGLETRPGHEREAINTAISRAEALNIQTPLKFGGLFEKQTIQTREPIPLVLGLRLTADAIQGGKCQAVQKHIRSTRTTVWVELSSTTEGKGETTEEKGESHGISSVVSVENKVREWSSKLGLSSTTADALTRLCERVFRLCNNPAYRTLFSYLEMACYQVLGSLETMYDDPSKYEKDVQRGRIQEDFQEWLRLMDDSYKGRYRGPSLSGELSPVPVLAHQGAYQRTLMVCDFLANMFLAMQATAYDASEKSKHSEKSKQNAVRLISMPVIVSRFGFQDISQIEGPRILHTYFLNIGWKLTFTPSSVAYLAHESAVAFLDWKFAKDVTSLTKFQDNSGHCAEDTILIDIIVDWLAINTLEQSTASQANGPNREAVKQYYRALVNMGDLFVDSPVANNSASNPSKAEIPDWKIRRLLRLALRYAIAVSACGGELKIQQHLPEGWPVGTIKDFIEGVGQNGSCLGKWASGTDSGNKIREVASRDPTFVYWKDTVNDHAKAITIDCLLRKIQELKSHLGSFFDGNNKARKQLKNVVGYLWPLREQSDQCAKHMILLGLASQIYPPQAVFSFMFSPIAPSE